MRSFIYKGQVYRSMSEACSKLKVSYQKVRRLCRHYVKASKDPAVALEWILTGHDPCLEVKTFKYQDDYVKSAVRVQNYRDRLEQRLMSAFQ